MPYIKIESAPMTDEQRAKLITSLTQVAAEILDVPKEFFMVMVNELPEKNIGVAGLPLDEFKAAYRAKQQTK
jgi:4-oxalocrotonate tautomerase